LSEIFIFNFQKTKPCTMPSEYYLKNKEKILARAKKRYEEDAEFREKTRKRYREKYQKDSEYKEYTLSKSRKRYYEDEEYRKKTIERAKARAKQTKKK